MTVAPALGSRALFAGLAWNVYLNHAAVSPPSGPLRAAVAAALDAYATRGAGAFMPYVEQRARLKQKLARLLGLPDARSDELAFLPNTSAGALAVAYCFPWTAGDTVLLLEGEFPANVTPWQRAAEHFGLPITWLPADAFYDPDGGLPQLEAQLRRGVRMVAVSATQFQTGLVLPLREIGGLCRRYGAKLFVDGIQACGIVPLDVDAMQIDYLASGSHKWLMGLEGTAFLYVRGETRPALQPRLAGWLSHDDPIAFLLPGPGELRYDRPLRQGASFLEWGTPNVLGCVALEAGLDLLLALGVPAIHEHVQRYLDPLEEGLRDRGFRSARPAHIAQRSGILSVKPPPGRSIPEVVAQLQAAGICVATPAGWLRFSPHWPNALDEVERVLAALDRAPRID